jgi:hypothetical protein
MSTAHLRAGSALHPLEPGACKTPQSLFPPMNSEGTSIVRPEYVCKSAAKRFGFSSQESTKKALLKSPLSQLQL